MSRTEWYERLATGIKFPCFIMYDAKEGFMAVSTIKKVVEIMKNSRETELFRAIFNEEDKQAWIHEKEEEDGSLVMIHCKRKTGNPKQLFLSPFHKDWIDSEEMKETIEKYEKMGWSCKIHPITSRY